MEADFGFAFCLSFLFGLFFSRNTMVCSHLNRTPLLLTKVEDDIWEWAGKMGSWLVFQLIPDFFYHSLCSSFSVIIRQKDCRDPFDLMHNRAFSGLSAVLFGLAGNSVMVELPFTFTIYENFKTKLINFAGKQKIMCCFVKCRQIHVPCPKDIAV